MDPLAFFNIRFVANIKKLEREDPLETFSEKVPQCRKNRKGGPFSLIRCFRCPDLALVVLVVSVKSGPFNVRSVVWRKKRQKRQCKSWAFASQKAPIEKGKWEVSFKLNCA